MEKYDLSKFITEYQEKVEELKQALSIDSKRTVFKELSDEVADSTFWNDQKHAQTVLAKFNLLKNTLTSFDSIQNKLKEILDLSSLASEDPEAMELLEIMIPELREAVSRLSEEALLSGKYDANDCILELHPGAGGTESMDWADMLYRMYTRFSAKKGFKLTVLDFLAGEEAGIKSVTLLIQGNYAYGLLKAERGVHRLVRISPFDSNARRHTSFVSCDVSPQIPEAEEVEVKDEDLKIDVFHSSGAGGQSVNTTDSAVRITHKPSGIVVTCQNERSQLQNREVAMKVLKSKLLEIEIKKQEEEMRSLKGNQMGINFGSQIRSYVFCPYTLVKDHRTGYEVGNIQSVMDGEIEGFMLAYLRFMAGNQND